MLGGGTFVNASSKILPGAYLNFVSAARASSTLSDRGVAAVPFVLDWGQEGDIFTVERADFEKNALKLFGYDYTHAKLKNLRELFKNARSLLCYRLNSDGAKATNTFATAKYGGIRGNDLKTVITANVDVPQSFDVKTLLGDVVVDVQTVATAATLVANDFVTFKTGTALALNAGLALTTGTNGAAVTGTNYSTFLGKLEAYSFNTLGCPSTDNTIAGLFDNFTKRMRDEMGVKFQLVRRNTETAPDYEGVILVANTVTDAGATGDALVYWVTGAESACPLNQSLTNATYNGEYTINVDYTQTQLENLIKSGQLAFHRVGSKINVLTDINSLITYPATKSADFSNNQTIRVLDQTGNDIAVLFNTKYLGKIPNNAAGRTSLWADIVNYNQTLEKMEAIENFDPDGVVVVQGAKKTSVVVGYGVTPTNCMAQLFATIVVS